MGLENFEEKSEQEATPEQDAYDRRQTKAKALFGAGLAALAVTIAEQSPITDLHQPKLNPLDEHTQQINTEEFQNVPKIDFKNPVINIDLKDKTKITNIDLPPEVVDIDLRQKVVEIDPPR